MSLKIAVVGIGPVAIGNYIPYLCSQPDVETGLYNRSPEKAVQAAEQFGVTAFTSLEELAAWQPDAALVLTNEKNRYEAASQMLDLSLKRLFFEKPLVASLGQAHVTEDDFEKGRALLDRAAEQGCETAMVFNYRFFEQTLTAKRIVAERSFGQLMNAYGFVNYACWSHCIDLVLHFGGNLDEMTALSGAADRPNGAGGFMAPDVTAAFRFENGGTGTFIGTDGTKWQHPLYELTLNFENGRIHMRDLDGTLEILDGATQLHEVHSLVRDTSRWDQYNASFKKSLGAYLESLRQGSPPPVPGIDGLQELQFEAAIKRSIAERRPVQVRDELPLSLRQA